MKLTDKQERFAQAVASGMTQADAYRTAYDAGDMKPETIWKRATELMNNGKVAGRVNELKGAIAAKLLWTREKSVSRLADIADDAEARANEKVAAIKELNAMHGFNAPAKIELSGGTVTRIELVAMTK